MIREREMGFSNPVFFDSTVRYSKLDGVVVIRTVSEIQKVLGALENFYVAIGGEHGETRCYISNALRDYGKNSPNLISPYANIHPSVSLSNGLQIMPGAQITNFASIGNDVIVNTNGSVDHESQLGDGVHVMAGACIAGRVKVGNFSVIGTNATVLPDLEIGNHVYIGAGSVVTRDIHAPGIYVGSPAKRIKDWNYVLDKNFINNILRNA